MSQKLEGSRPGAPKSIYDSLDMSQKLAEVGQDLQRGYVSISLIIYALKA